MIQRNLQALVIFVRTDKGTEFLNKTLYAFFKEEGIEHQTSTPRTLEQNDVVERRNCTLVEAARMMLSASKFPLFFWAEAIATACYTQNRCIIIPTHKKTTYHIINDRKHTCFVRNLEGVDLLSGYQETNLYTLSIRDMMTSSPTCLLSKALKTKSWLWHRQLSHLNFGAINHLAKNGLVRGLPKLKFEKDHLCSACAIGKSKKQSQT
ncbi:retrovirus-related pol polyprotein from transposon TNT 1-94 [Tanacetum coccineum]